MQAQYVPLEHPLADVDEKGRIVLFIIWWHLSLIFCLTTGADLPNSAKLVLLVALAVEAYVFLATNQAKEFGDKTLTWLLNTSRVWPEGLVYKNLEVWKSRGVGLWPSITDNLCNFFRIVVGPHATIVIWAMVPTAVICIFANQASLWIQHLQGFFSVPENRDVVHLHVDEPIGNIVLQPWALCSNMGYVPMPYSYVIFKLVLSSFVQDLIFGSGDLFGRKKMPLSSVSKAFTCYQVMTVFSCYVKGVCHAVHGDFGETVWDMYSGFVFFTLNHTSIISLILLIVKLFWETNVVDHGAPPGLSRILQNRVHIPPYDYPKAQVFWMLLFLLAIPLLPAACTHLIIAIVMFIVVALAYPLWLAPVYLLYLVGKGIGNIVGIGYIIEPLNKFLYDVAVTGTTLHAGFWEGAAILLFMTLIGTYMRKLLWEVDTRMRLWSSGSQHSARDVQVGDNVSVMWNDDGNFYNAMVTGIIPGDPERYRVEWDKATSIPQGIYEQEAKLVRLIWGPEPHGPYGFNLPCYTLLFSTPVFFLTGSLLAASIAWFGGAGLGSNAIVGAFNMHQLKPYNTCMIEAAVPIGSRILEWLSLV